MTIFDQVRFTVADSLGIDVSEIQRDSSLVSLGADSMDRAQLILDLEESCHVEILDDDFPKLVTIQDLVTYVDSRSPIN